MANDPNLVPVPEMKLELVPIPVSDVDRAKAFYELIGFGDVHDTQVSPSMRVVQFTPPGSACSIVFGTGMAGISDMVPGSVKGVHLVVKDIHEAREAIDPPEQRNRPGLVALSFLEQMGQEKILGKISLLVLCSPTTKYPG